MRDIFLRHAYTRSFPRRPNSNSNATTSGISLSILNVGGALLPLFGIPFRSFSVCVHFLFLFLYFFFGSRLDEVGE